MNPYASNTHCKRNLDALRRAGWSILISPGKKHYDPPRGFRYAIDNGAWRAFLHNLPFDHDAFMELIARHGRGAEFIVVPDKVADAESLEFSLSYLDRLRGIDRPLLAVQDGMKAKDIGAILERHSNLGLFLGGSTEWKLKTLYGWGMVAHALRRYFHVGRVNTTRRMRLCAEAGANSIDGTSCSMFSCNVPKLDAARRQPSLLTPLLTAGRP